jgi:hypothetical protein
MQAINLFGIIPTLLILGWAVWSIHSCHVEDGLIGQAIFLLIAIAATLNVVACITPFRTDLEDELLILTFALYAVFNIVCAYLRPYAFKKRPWLDRRGYEKAD